MQAKKTLLILAPGFPKNEMDTTCLPAVQHLVNGIKQNFPSVEIIILSFQYPYSAEEYKWNGVEIIPFNGRNRGNIQRYFLWRRVFRKMNQLKKDKDILGVLSLWCGECCLVGKRFADKNHLAHYCWISGQDAKKENKYVRRIRPTFGELVAISDILQNEFEKNHGIRPAYVIPPGVDLSFFSASPGRRDIDVMAAGSLIPLKRFHIFIDAVYELKKMRGSIKAVLCGTGKEEKNLFEYARSLQLENTIEFTGQLSYTETLQLMERSKIFLHPSEFEGFSGVCMEALAAGAKVISFRRAMKKEIPHWFITDTKEEMIAKTLQVLNDEQTASPVLSFTMENTARQMMQLFGY